MTNHLKSLAAPRTWDLSRKSNTFTLNPDSCGHPLSLCMPVGTLIRQLGLATTAKEARHILNTQEVLLDGKKIKKQDLAVGLMDVLSFPGIKKSYRMLLNKNGILELIQIDENESKIKPCKIKNKTSWKGKIQLNLSDGRNIIVDKNEYKTGDSLIVEVPKNNIKEHLGFTKGSTITVIGGKNSGSVGKVDRIEQNKVFYEDNNGEMKETVKKYVYVIGKEKSEIKLL